jgi:putative acetyltransferase
MQTGSKRILIMDNQWVTAAPVPLSGRETTIIDFFRSLLVSRTMPTNRFTLRRATGEDAHAVAAVFSASFRLLSFLPRLHTIAEDRAFIANVILRDCEVMVAEDDGGITSFLARQGHEVRLLYTRPDRIGEGAGTQLIEAAKKSGVRSLELWCFQANARARRFYEARGFRAVGFTDGTDNEEKMPDVRYRWELGVDR